MKKNIKQLAKDSMIYGVGNAFAKIAAFVLIPVYTRYLTTYEYGTIEMMGTILWFMGGFCNLGLITSQTFLFFSVKEDKHEEKKLVTSMLQLRLIIGVIVICSAILMSSKLNIYFFDGRLDKSLLPVAFIGYFCLMFKDQFIEILRYTRQAAKYIAIMVSKDVLLAIISIILIIFFNMGVLGYYIGYCAAAATALIFTWKNMKGYLSWSRLHTDWWRKLLKFGFPLVPMALGLVVINVTDRWCIKYFMVY